MNMLRILPFVLLFTPVMLFAQSSEETDIYIGISPGMSMRWQQGTMRTTDGFYDCCAFTGGSGIGFSSALRALVPLGSALWLRAGFGWERVVSDYASERKNYPILGQGNTVEYADLQNDLSVTMSAVQIDVGLMYMLLEPGLYVAVGPGVTVPLSPSWTQTEKIAGPPGLRYKDGSSQQVLFDVEIPGTRPFVSLRFGGGAIIPVTEDVRLAPELMFSVPLMETQPDYRWSMSGFDLVVGVMLRL